MCVCVSVLPQGWYSLGLMVQAEQKVPLPVLAQLGLAELYVADSSVLLSVLYHRSVNQLCEQTTSTVPFTADVNPGHALAIPEELY